ncbi:MAG TPA: type II toxin-antitoxin system death-on-curing family toxin [Magnetospirillaceae bacterium]|nr:type II toxin-antitoxin system death-on-curing family toxin [Magnetospirillaceae bacterium]
MTQWRWVREDVLLAIHDAQLAEHGGGAGIRDKAMIEMALDHPRNRAAYGEPDWADLAVAYAFGFCRNHGFVDGNKRTAWVAARLFIRLNGVEVVFAPVEAIHLMETLAAGEIDEAAVALWFRARFKAG